MEFYCCNMHTTVPAAHCVFHVILILLFKTKTNTVTVIRLRYFSKDREITLHTSEASTSKITAQETFSQQFQCLRKMT